MFPGTILRDAELTANSTCISSTTYNMTTSRLVK